VLALAALAAGPTRARATTAAMCVDVASTGASPDDGVDDRVAIQAAVAQALAAGGPHAVCFHAGTYDVTPAPGNASFNLGSVGGSPATDLALLGAGSATVLRMNGNGGGQSWFLFLIDNGAARIAFRDLVLDGSLATNTPSARLIQIGTNGATQVSEISLDGVTLRGSRNEAIQIAGGATPTTHSVAIRSSVFQGNLGAAIDVRGGADQIQVAATMFVGDGGEDVRTRGTPVDGLAIVNSVFVRDPAAATAAISLQGGTPTAPNTRATIAGNLLLNGSFDLVHHDRVTLANNLIIGSPQAGARPEISLRGRADSTIVDANAVVRTATTAANVVSADNSSGVAPTRTVVRGNLFAQAAPANIVQLLAVADVVFSANQLVFTSPSAATFSGVQFRALVAPTDRFVITDNLVAGDAGGGTLAAAIRLSDSTGFTIAHAVVTGNVARGCVRGVAFDNTFTAPITVADNLFDASAVDVAGGFSAIVTGGNRGEPVQLVGIGDPTAASVAAPNGSIYQRRDGGAHTTLYVRQAGAWVAK
jgi:hypothetical protein